MLRHAPVLGDLPGDSSALPDGIQKTVLTPAPEEHYSKPKSGDEVHVHYTGSATASPR